MIEVLGLAILAVSAIMIVWFGILALIDKRVEKALEKRSSDDRASKGK